MSEKKVHRFQAEVNQVLRLVINSLYRHKEIFLRELVSNGSDALDRLRFRAIREPDLLDSGDALCIRIIADKNAGTLTIEDNGDGMSAEELVKNLGTVAWSGSRDFLEKLEQAQAAQEEGMQLIGQFGVGFYSSYLVADRVEVISCAAGAAEAHRWASDAQESFTVEPAERKERGTAVVLHLKGDQKEFLEPFRLRQLVTRYSDYISHPVQLAVERKSDDDSKPAETVFEDINRASALWQRPPAEVEKEQYEEFYRHLTHDWEAPLAWRHFKIEGTQMFTGLLFLPRQRPFDLFDPQPRYGVRLHVQRVFVMDEAEELVPRWLRFLRGVIDSEDLPLNVSRETLQDSRAVKTIKKQVTVRTLDLLDELAAERAEDYQTFWNNFGAVLKEGLHFDPDYKQREAKLLRYESSRQPGLTSLSDYVERMPEGQTSIYYAAGISRSAVESSPHLEALTQRGYEVLFMTDAVDPFAVSTLGEFEGKPLVSAMTADLKLNERSPEEEKENAADKQQREAVGPLLERIQKVLEDRVQEVRASERLTDSPACLVIPDGGLQPHIERMLRARRMDLPPTKRILEVNVKHPLVQGMNRLQQRDADSEKLAEWIEVVYAQALLAEGSPVDDPARLAQRLGKLLTTVVGTEAAEEKQA